MIEKPKRRGPAPGTGGRPKGSKGPEKVKMTVHVLPETADAIKGRGRPGAVLDAVFSPKDKKDEKLS